MKELCEYNRQKKLARKHKHIELIGKKYLRVNSALGRVNRRLDDNSDSNIERVVAMGESWWELFGEQALDLLSE